MKIKAITPLGTFISKEMTLTDPERQKLEEMLTDGMKNLSYYTCETSEGSAHFGSEVIRNSVFVILD